MASVRQLKKDIDALTTHVVGYCFEYMHLYGETDKEEPMQILRSAVELRNDLFSRANHPDGKHNPKLVKAHYRKIVEDLLSKTDEHYDRLRVLLDKHK